MKLKSVTIENFRCYKNPTPISINDITLFIGKNDIGKSAVLDALEIFFNNTTVKIDNRDSNIHSDSSLVSITCEFSEPPSELILDSTVTTSLKDEFLLTATGNLKIKKVFDCAPKTPKCEVFIIAQHPSIEGAGNLLELKEKDLQSIIKKKNLDTSLKGNAAMRKAIWASYEDLLFSEQQIPVTKEDSKKIWDKVEPYLPLFALFQSDRSSKDSDDEVQNPLKSAITAAIAGVQAEIDAIQARVESEVMSIATATHDALKTIDANLASELTPTFTPATPAKWSGLFSVSMDTDKGIPLNKRGSGVRRMILVSFFKAEAERKLKEGSRANIIYAIEEPETAQHPNNQRILLESFLTLSRQDGCQIILTSHSPGLVADLPAESIRFISRDANTHPIILDDVSVFGEVADALGLVPDSRVKGLICLEGPTDVDALKALSQILHCNNANIPDFTTDDRFAFITLGGSTLKHWVAENYLKNLNLPEFHIYDSDVTKYQGSVDEVNARTNESWAVRTAKHEIESYLHADAIKAVYDVEIEVADFQNSQGHAVPKAFGTAYSAKMNFDGIMGDNKSKSYLTRAFYNMTHEQIVERDPEGEIAGWFTRMAQSVK